MRIAICQAENTDILKDFINRYDKEKNISISEYNNALEFLSDFISSRFDALFFDDTLIKSDIAEIKGKDGQIRLISIIDQDVSQPICEGLWSLLQKPISNLLVQSTLDRLSSELDVQDHHSMMIKTKGSISRIVFEQIEYVEVLGSDITFHLCNGKQVDIQGTFAEYEKRLVQLPDFVKTHRSFIVNLRYVQKLQKDGITTESGTFVPVSKHIYPKFKKDYMGSLFFVSEDIKNIPIIPKTSQKNILLVDDNLSELNRWGKVLAENKCTVSTATNEEIALDLLKNNQFDCIILDVQLKNSSGFDLHEKIKKITSAPIIYLSTLSDSEHQTRGFHAGGIDYITKDVTNELFWLKVNSRIEANCVALAERTSGNVKLRLNERKAFVSGKEIALTSIEFDLLNILIQHTGVIFSPDELYSRIWGKQTKENAITLQVHMSGLFSKLLQIESNHRYIEVVWGKGYRFLPDFTEVNV